ncbi:MAG: hypothetical protein J6584_07510 [Lactobacillus sp.]|jgi:hypothetical protein|uniref:hypothetical protein n=1 Tax=Bombilactobacillus bombi TaxID=1303590 RepID=UPI0013C2AA80|nr:hypothetical protein [Bombilactobacillus bombi]MCO6542042.1 hypothetical protein [Lactobacillus sp.]MCO6543792.1 hypothetical protein [Lactobacillus sp.]
MVNTHKGVTGRRRPTSKLNSAKRRQHTDEVLSFLMNGLDDMKKAEAKKSAKK